MSSNTIAIAQVAGLKEYKAFFKEIKEKIIESLPDELKGHCQVLKHLNKSSRLEND